jgi:TRAP-type C4-dicarboxylate transport system permease large subunit
MAMVVMGGMGQISIGALFAAGFLPAAVMALAICALIYLQARSGRLPGDHHPLVIMYVPWIALVVPRLVQLH